MMRIRFAAALAALSLLGASALWSGAAQAQCASLTTLGVASTQNFDTLSSVVGTGVTWTDNTTIPGWYSTRVTYNVATGSSNAGALYSFGVAGTNPVTDRALGGVASGGTGTFYWAGCFTNNTGSALTSLDLAYIGEQWRDGGNATPVSQPMAVEYQTAAAGVITGANVPATGWTAVPALTFTSPTFTVAAAALDGNAVANRTARSTNVVLAVPAGNQFWIRWIDINDGGNDHGLSIDNFSLTPQGAGPVVPALSISDVTVTEGNVGTVNAVFNVTLSAPAGLGGVTFDIATANNTATLANNDYVSNALVGQSIPAGSSGPFVFTVVVNGDTTVEPNETFFVNVSNVVGANVGDGQGLGTITNDDFVITPIRDIQGAGATSPLNGLVVTTTGVVTGRKSNGFFMQEPDASIDGNPLTSEGIFVFTSVAPPVAAAVGNRVQVTATVLEFVPTQDPLQPPLTELTFATVSLLSAGNPIPAAIPLTTTFPNPAGPFDQLERVEGMRVSIASLTANSGTQGSVNEPNATGSSNGVFSGVVTGVARSLREAGIAPPDPAPAGSIPPIPRWDGNPELIQVDSDALGSAQINLSVGQTVTNLVGPLDYGFRRYTLLPELGSTPTVTGTGATVLVSAPLPTEVTIGTYNLERFFDTVNDPGISEPILTALAFNTRLNKASLGVRNAMQTPDIVGVVEVENIATLQALATKINNDAVAASQPNPQYSAFLVEGNDVGGIDVGFLVKTAPVVGITPRVTVNAVVQELDGTLFVNPNASTETLNDRPPLRLDAVVNNATGQTYPVTVIVNHLRSLSNSASPAADPNGWPTEGHRVRAKRQAQAVDLANFVQNRQVLNPNEQIVLIGDFNAFEFNDGLGDSIGTIIGVPTPDNQTAVIGDGADLVTPNFDNLFDSVPADERYSFIFGGVAQSLDHALISASVISGTVAPRLEHARINSGFAELERNNAATPNRLADHDPLVVYLTPNGFVPIDLAISKVANIDPVAAGSNLDYTIAVQNLGTQPALNTVWTDTLPTGTRFVSLSTVAGWTCTTPLVGATGTINCSNASVAVGTSTFTLVVSVDANVAAGLLNNTAAVSTTSIDSDPLNNTAIAATNVMVSADVSITKTDGQTDDTAGTSISYTIVASNAGPSNAASVTVLDSFPATLTGVTWTCVGAAGGTCAANGSGNIGDVTSLPVGGSVTYTVSATIAPDATGTLSNTASATVGGAASDPTPGNNSATDTTTLLVSADLAILLSNTPNPVIAGTNLTYTATVSNSGPSTATAVTITLPLPANTTFVSGSVAGGGSCSGSPVVCTVPTSLAPGASSVATIVLAVAPAAPLGSTINATATVNASSPDPLPGNNSANSSATVSTSADLQLGLSSSAAVVAANVPVTFTATSLNNGPSDAQGVSITITLTPDFRFTGLVAAGATCTTPQVGNTGAIVCTWAGATAPGVTRTLQVTAFSNNQGISAVNASTTSTTTDPFANNNANAVSVQVGLLIQGIPTLSVYGLTLLGLMLGLMGFVAVRRER